MHKTKFDLSSYPSQVICLKLVRAFERGEHPKAAVDVPDMDEFAKQLLSRAPGGVPTNFYRAAIEDTTIITMKGVSLGPSVEHVRASLLCFVQRRVREV